MKINIYSKIILVIFLIYALASISSIIKKRELISILNNREYSFGAYIEDVTTGRGGLKAKYEFKTKSDKLIQSTQGKGVFEEASAIYGNYYVVVYNSQKPEESIFFLNLEVNDSINNFLNFKKMTKFRQENYEKTIDSFFLKNLTDGFSKYFPPYYNKYDLQQLKNNPLKTK